MTKRLPGLSQGLTAEEKAELGDLDQLAQAMAGYVAPQPGPEDTQQLLASLRPLVQTRRQSDGEWASELSLETESSEMQGLRRWITLAWAQTPLMAPSFWLAVAAVFGIGLLSTVIRGEEAGLLSAGLILISPILAAGGVAYAFRPSARSLWEIERACPIQPLELLYARLGLVLGVNLVLSLMLLGLVSVQQPQLVLWRLVATWIGPMLGLTGIALYTSVRWGAVASAAVPVSLWAVILTLSWQRTETGSPRGLTGFLFTMTSSDLFLTFSALLALAGAILIAKSGRSVMGEQPSWN